MCEVIAILDFDKETINKIRYQAIFRDTPFSLYIQKWRISNRWPSKIIAIIEAASEVREHMASRIVRNGVAPIAVPINIIVSQFVVHTQTVRFDPPGDAADWEIGATYIPSCLLPDPLPQRLRIQVHAFEHAA